MNDFPYPFARLPKGRDITTAINAAAQRLFLKLGSLDPGTLAISDYNKRYLADYLKELHRALQRYSFILAWSVAPLPVPPEDFVFLEYGGGSGILSLLAKELGIGKVIYNDIYDVSCADARVIGRETGDEADHYVCGDIDDVIAFLKADSISCDAVASYDVIEHVYDVEGFLGQLSELSDKAMRVVMTSSANALNPRVRRTLTKGQLEAEHSDRQADWGHKDRDSLRAYAKVRDDMIRGVEPGLSDVERERLVRATRGMMEEDIVRSVKEYTGSGAVPPEPEHPTNTCDPYTGNWCEHLMDFDELKNTLSRAGFQDVRIVSGYYGRSESSAKRALGAVLNGLIYALGGASIRIAPYFTLYGVRRMG